MTGIRLSIPDRVPGAAEQLNSTDRPRSERMNLATRTSDEFVSFVRYRVPAARKKQATSLREGRFRADAAIPYKALWSQFFDPGALPPSAPRNLAFFSSFNYDYLGNITSMSSSINGNSGGDMSAGFSYDNEARLASASLPAGSLSFAYDDPRDFLTRISRPNGVTTSFSHDPAGYLSSLSDSSASLPAAGLRGKRGVFPNGSELTRSHSPGGTSMRR